MITTKQRLLCLAVFAAMTTACSSGGSSLNTGGGNASNIPGATGPEFIKEKNVEDSEVYKLNQADNSEPAPQVEYGYTSATPVSGYTAGGKSYNIDADIDTKNAQKDDSENYDKIEFVIHPNDDYPTKEKVATKSIELTSLKESLEYTDVDITGDQPLKPEDYLLLKAGYTSDYSTLAKFFELNNTKIGGIFTQDPSSGFYGNLFYKAKGATENLPALGTATYNGVWDVTQAVPQPGEHAAGYSREGFYTFSPMQLNVNFGENTVDGKFEKRLAHKQAYAYTFEGELKGNTFTGEATQSNISQENLDNATRIQDKADVSGGFFGDKAQEIAGKIISKDRTGIKDDEVKKMDPRIFGVFVAKQTEGKDLEDAKPITYNSSGVINANLDAKAEKAFNEDGFVQALEKTSKLPNINMIEINGTTIDLSEAIKAQDKNNTIFLNTDMLPLQFTRFGSIQGETATDLSYFYQGQLTQDMPTADKANYEGSWIAHGLSKNGTPYTVGKDNLSKVKFDVDFGNKLLSGKFLSNSGAEAMTLGKTEFDGNSFSGVASIENTGLSTNRTPGKDGAITGNVNISGNFFGDNANEIGGKFNKDDLSFAGVFAGKKTK